MPEPHWWYLLRERQEFAIFQELLRMVPGLEAHIMESSSEEVMLIGELIIQAATNYVDQIQKGANGACADDTKGFNHERTGAFLCPAGLDWAKNKTKLKLVNGQIQVISDQWLVFLYANYTYDTEDPWNGLLQSFQAHFHFPKLGQSGTKGNLVWQHMNPCILQLLNDPDEKDEVDQLLTWWNRQVFPLCSDPEPLPSKDSVLAMIHQKWAEYKERASIAP
ncbi:hypothetical protein BDN67DRAFT_985697 [Paxillus ammoniavirescens]|nr:hypothetical protein BDN67DRAFT_985697 [Paxillus ammoniavirescens]